ncbi:glycosyltransferase family 2 protein [Streptomyces sp. NPDC000345]|uniref:glycosyltransferase family 2 protein n=1 Tax=Streptomyces sp. NPDC000345 TaxID=3364537 RepID=UPI003698D0E9
MNAPDVSVVIPAYDRPEELRRTLISLTRQTLPVQRFEVIVIDDGSPSDVFEKSWEVIEGMENLTLIRNSPGRGVSVARNVGARQAKGELLVFLDVDCMAHPALLEEHLKAQRERPSAVCGFTHGRELTPSAWSLLLGDEWDMEEPEEAFRRARAEPRLHDPLTELLHQPSDNDWAFFWTHNVSVPRASFEEVGGFCEDFELKGVEDMEIGLRLQLAGVPTVFVPQARALHQPHERDRNADMFRDRRNDLRLLVRHPRLEVEAVCSFDIVNAQALHTELVAFSRRLPPSAVDCAHLDELPGVRAEVEKAERVLLLGSSQGWPAGLRPPSAEINPLPGAQDRTTAQLLGTRLPFVEPAFDLVLITDYWRALPERTLCRVLSEALRCGGRLLLLSGVSTSPLPAPDPALAQALERNDRPFWEFTVGLSREFHQFQFTPIERGAVAGADGRVVRALTAQARPWSRSSLTDVFTSPSV